MEQLAELIRDIPDFPKPGVLFKDITTLLRDPRGFHASVDALTERFRERPIDVVVGMESRGFILGAPVAYLLGAGFVPVRKLGKLPAETLAVEYQLEYGTNTLEIHRDAIQAGQRVLLIDDLLATGGTVRATLELVQQLGATVVGVGFLIELEFLRGRALLSGFDVQSIIRF